MNILVSGGAGFIGSHLCDYLIADGHRVIAVDNLSSGTKENIAHLMGNEQFYFYHVDILDYERMSQIFQKEHFEIVFHLAANSDIAMSRENPDTDFHNTLQTTYTILKLMKDFEVKKIFFSSTSAIYGETNTKVDENFGPLFPVSHYGAGKLASEAFISSFVENYCFQAWIVRFPNVVGERATHGVIFDFINKLRKNPNELEVLGNGEQYKPYLYVKDLIEAIALIWKNTNSKINFFNVGVDSRTRVKDIAMMVIEEMGLAAKIRYTGGDRGWIGDVPKFEYELSKISALGWRAKISSNEAVKKSIQYILGKR